MSESVLSMEDIKVYYPVRRGLFGKTEYVKAVDGVDLEVKQGEVLGIVGESGCGKSTLGKAICHLIKVTDGKVILKGKNLTELSEKEMRKERKEIQMIFQDPYASLNPRMTIHDIIAEPMIIHHMYATKEEMDAKVIELLKEVGMNPEQQERYPHEFSGGQRQRVGIARALATEPTVIVADEPVSALDVSIQSQVLNLLSKLKKERNLTMIFIAHDLSVVEHISNRVAVMYLGNVVELGSRDELFDEPLHPYTQSLLDAVPHLDPDRKTSDEDVLQGEVPSPIDPPSGCPFHTRCKKCMEICAKEKPVSREVKPGHFVACHLFDEK